MRKEEWLITVEEIEIIVTAKVEEALKEFGKMLPAIKKAMKEAQEAFSKIDMKKFQKAINQSIVLAKKQLQDLKKSTENNKIKIKLTNADAIKQIKQVKKELDALHKEQTARKC